MKPERVRFSSHPRPFRVLAAQCINPACACSEVTFDLVEVVEAGTPASARLRLGFRVDPDTWREVKAPERPAAQAELVQEFLRDYPETERVAFQQAARQKLQMAHRLGECRFDAETLAGDRLVSFAEIVSEPDPTKSTTFLGHLEHDGRTYLIRDLYCANPQCPCSQVHLEFLWYTPPSTPNGEAIAKPHLLARVSLTGDARVEQVLGGTDAQAAALLAAWWPDHREVLEDLKWRYGKIKEIGRRSMPIGKLLAPDAPPAREPRLSGQIRLRVRYGQLATPYFDYLMVSPAEMRKIVASTGWKISRLLPSAGSTYIAILEKGGLPAETSAVRGNHANANNK